MDVRPWRTGKRSPPPRRPWMEIPRWRLRVRFGHYDGPRPPKGKVDGREADLDDTHLPRKNCDGEVRLGVHDLDCVGRGNNTVDRLHRTSPRDIQGGDDVPRENETLALMGDGAGPSQE